MASRREPHAQRAAAATSVGPVTLSDVAHAAGVSLATASRVLHPGKRRPNEELRLRVTRTAEELQYAPNAHAQAVARGRSNVVGLVVHDISDPYFSSIAAGVLRAADEVNLIVNIADTRRDLGSEVRYVAALRRQRAEAIIVAGSRSQDRGTTALLEREVMAFQREGGRVSMISQHHLDVDTVLVENRAGARALALALHVQGYRSFAVLAGPPSHQTAFDRLSGFRAGLSTHGVTVGRDRVVRSEFTRDGGYAAMQTLLHAANPLPVGTCVFAVNDLMAVGAMSALRDEGVDLPGAVAVAGFDDIETLRDVTPSLSTVRIPLEDLGTFALALVCDTKPPTARVQRVSSEVVLRDSTPPRRPS